MKTNPRRKLAVQEMKDQVKSFNNGLLNLFNNLSPKANKLDLVPKSMIQGTKIQKIPMKTTKKIAPNLAKNDGVIDDFSSYEEEFSNRMNSPQKYIGGESLKKLKVVQPVKPVKSNPPDNFFIKKPSGKKRTNTEFKSLQPKKSPRLIQNNQKNRIQKEILDMKEHKKKLESQILQMESIRVKKMNENLKNFSIPL